MAKNGMVNLLTILDDLPGGVTLSDIRPVVKGKVNFAPEQVDGIVSEIKANQAARTGNGPAKIPEPLVGHQVLASIADAPAPRPLGELTLKRDPALS